MLRLATHASLPFELNLIELVAILLVMAGLAQLGRRLEWPRRSVAIALLLAAPVLILTAAETTQFMTMDEWGMSLWLLDPANRLSSAIVIGLYGTGAVVQLPIALFLNALGAERDTILMLLKAFWWMLANAIFLVIAFNILCLANVRRNAINLVLVFAGLALIPTSQLAAKTLNYDLLSMSLAVLAVILALRAIQENRERLFLGAVASASLAAQEKSLVGPVLILLLVVWPVWKALAVVDLRKRVRHAAWTALWALAVPLCISLLSRLLFALLAPSARPAGLFASSVDAMSSWSWFLISLMLPVAKLPNSTVGLAVGSTYRVTIAIGAGLLIIFASVIAAAVAPPLVARFKNWSIARRDAPFALPAGLLVLLFVGGAIAVNHIHAYWAPYHPSRLPSSALVQAFGETTLHFDSSTAIGHALAAAAHALAVLVVAIPTALWLVLALAIVVACFATRKKALPGARPEPFVNWSVTFLIVISVALPVAIAMVGIPFAHRYFNVWLLLLASSIIVLGVRGFLRAEWPHAAQLGVGCIVLAGLVVGLAPFRPLFAAYRPFWITYGDAREAESGRLNASWMGWGEEIMRLGKEIERACLTGDTRFAGTPCNEVTLQVMISGRWLPGPSTIQLKAFGEPVFDAKTFIAHNRLMLIQNAYKKPAIEPDFVAAYDGYALGWAYRGDKLAASGYTLK
ncbi:hypothetical protein [Bosea sp. TND4EK4]|uniref:hypothetical protein n=1 Tax=Bosea sp. TND4EK4 TaxID=1907408 RepID=UPI0009571846|nr:hypothetical protein [Bosea sp. TND4EK4]SIR41181.1 hypothetical protein SAMN05880592_1201 [Bosea sp. TND4EK4]